MSEPEDDDEFEAYLKRRAPIGKGLRSDEGLEPPAHLDRIVIGNARRAIKAPSPVHVYRAPKWALPVGLAAILVISFAIVLDLGVRERRREMAAQAPTAEAMVTEQQRDTPGPAPASPPPPVSRIATNPWPPGLPANAVPSDSSGAEPRANSTEQEGSDKARTTRLARVEAAAKRERTDTEVESTAPDGAAARGRLASSLNAPLQSVTVPGARRTANDATLPVASGGGSMTTLLDLSITMDLSSALASTASSARAAIEGATVTPSRAPSTKSGAVTKPAPTANDHARGGDIKPAERPAADGPSQ
jgi:hypothetical protein